MSIEKIINNLKIIEKEGIQVLKPKVVKEISILNSELIIPLYDKEICNYLSILSFADQLKVLREICNSPKYFLIYEVNELETLSSGFAFSFNPVAHIDDEVVIEGREGLRGLMLVREFDRFVFSKKSKELIELFYYGNKPHVAIECAKLIFRTTLKIEEILKCRFISTWICRKNGIQILSTLCIDSIL